MTNSWASLGASDFSQNVGDLLPPGDAWASVRAGGMVVGIGAAMGDLHASAYQLSEVETLPSMTNVLLADWETDFGLPDCCTPLGATVQQRQAALLAKIAAVGGQSPAYFVSVAAALGYTITITEGSPGSFTWTIHASSTAPVSVFRVGESDAGDVLESSSGNGQLECVIRQIMPAHTVLNFSYS